MVDLLTPRFSPFYFEFGPQICDCSAYKIVSVCYKSSCLCSTVLVLTRKFTLKLLHLWVTAFFLITVEITYLDTVISYQASFQY